MSNRSNDFERSAEHWHLISLKDVQTLHDKEKQYKGSWKKRGGCGAFENLCRKWDRLQAAVEEYGNNIFMAAAGDQRPEGILDDIGDLRRYLILTEAEIHLLRGDGEKASKVPVTGFRITGGTAAEGGKVEELHGLPKDYRSPGYKMPKGEMTEHDETRFTHENAPPRSEPPIANPEDAGHTHGEGSPFGSMTVTGIEEIRRGESELRQHIQETRRTLDDTDAKVQRDCEDLKERIHNLNHALYGEENLARESEERAGRRAEILHELLPDLRSWSQWLDEEAAPEEGARLRQVIRKIEGELSVWRKPKVV